MRSNFLSPMGAAPSTVTLLVPNWREDTPVDIKWGEINKKGSRGWPAPFTRLSRHPISPRRRLIGSMMAVIFTQKGGK
jgi:hypothetical protein